MSDIEWNIEYIDSTSVYPDKNQSIKIITILAPSEDEAIFKFYRDNPYCEPLTINQSGE